MGWLARRFELSRGGRAHNIRAMEGLRGFAVFLVFLVHYVTLVSPWLSTSAAVLPLAMALHTIGNTGVDLFFVLSGYLIYGSLLSRRQSFGPFMARRIERIYPAFIVVLALYTILSYVFPAESKIPAAGAAASVYVTQNLLLLPGIFPIEPMITVAWSLSYEMLFYVAIPLIIALCTLRHRSALWRSTFFVGVALLIVAASGLHDGPVRLIMFVSGILLYEVMARRHVPTPSSLVGLLVLIVGLLGTLLAPEASGRVVFKACLLFVAFFVLCLTCFRNSSGWLARSFSWTPVRWLGNMSYSYYLLHGLALKAGFLALSAVWSPSPAGSWFFWALLAPMFALTLIPTAALFLPVERPFSLLPRRVTSPSPPGYPPEPCAP
jgi:peptidoglycan/LPS O-acetylase OafA/YrhL